MVRRGSGTDSEARFWQSVVTSPAFDPLRDKHGGKEALAAFLREKVVGRRRRHHRAQPGDVGRGGGGGRRRHRRAHQLVGPRDVQPAARVGAAHQRRGHEERHRVRQAHAAPGAHPHQHLLRGRQPLGRGVGGRGARRLLPAPSSELPGRGFRSSRRPPTARWAPSASASSPTTRRCWRSLRQQARDRLREENRDPDDEQALKLAVARERKVWIRSELTKQGVERAAKWGWPNIYTYTKSMGDQLVARETGIVRAIVRPGDRRERGGVSVPRLERGLHHLGAAGLPGAQGAERAAGVAQADPRRRPGRPRRGRRC